MATAPIADKYRSLFVKAQASLGQTQTLADGDAIPAWDINWTLRGEPTIPRDNLAVGFGGTPVARPVGSVGWEVSFKTEVVVPIIAGNTSGFEEMYALFEACPVNIPTPVSDIQISPVSGYVPLTDVTPVNIEMHTQDGLKYSTIDAIGTFKIVGEAGGISYIEWTFQGKFVDVDEASLVAPDFPSSAGNPCVMKGMTWSDGFGDDPLLITRFEFEPGLTLRESRDAVETYGYGLSTAYYESPPVLRWQEPEEDTAGSRDLFNAWQTLGGGDLTVTLASSLGDSFAILLKTATISAISRTTVEGYQAFDVEAYGITTDGTGNDQWKITVT